MSYFGGILYPVLGQSNGTISNTESNMALHAYAAIEDVASVTSTDFQAATSTVVFNSMGSIFPVTNVYKPSGGTNITLSQYGWNGIYNKTTNSTGQLGFTSTEFATDINGILGASGGLSEANVVSSYTNGVLTIRGFQSSTIDFSITDEDCILMETNGSSGSSGGSGPYEYQDPSSTNSGIRPVSGSHSTSCPFSVISGGTKNCNAYSYSFIGSGFSNTGSVCGGFIGGGNGNKLEVDSIVLSKGSNNIIVGGVQNAICEITAGCNDNFIGGGQQNLMKNNVGCNVIGGGKLNKICVSRNSFMGSGCCNEMTFSCWSSLIGGFQNLVQNSNYATIGGGYINRIVDSSCSTIGSGNNNFICQSGISAIVGGCLNITNCSCMSFIGGGCNNKICCTTGCQGIPNKSAILGGCSNTIVHTNSFIIGSCLSSTANCATFMNNAVITGSLTVGCTSRMSSTTGRIDATNDVVAFSTSDRRLKENILPIENALCKVIEVTGNTFDWKELNKEQIQIIHGNTGKDVGVIAQEIETILPEAVTTRDNGYKAVNYEKIIPLLIEAIKDQQKQIDELKRKI